MPYQKTGPLSEAELFELWLSTVDDAYSSPLVTQPDSGLSLVTQNHAQLARVSLAADRTFQSFYILPWSGQTAPPAGGASLAEVDLLVARSGQGVLSANFPIILTPALWYDHAPIDSDAQGPIQVLTGRRYSGSNVAVIGPGHLDPVVVTALSERPFAGYNLPLPNTITVIEQQTGLANDSASIVPLSAVNQLVLHNEPDVLGPAHIGQYVLMTSGANTRRVRRVIGYLPPGVSDGGTALLAATATLNVSSVVGTFALGETNVQAVSAATATFLWTDGQRMVVEALTGTLVSGHTVTGSVSSAVAAVPSIDDPAALTAETGTAAWRLLDWVVDIGLLVTNPTSPSGAQTPMLDSLGDERNIRRSPGEPDAQYRERVATPADVVSPNALRRQANRALAPQGVSACLREIGQANFRGFFYDGDPSSVDPAVAFAYDLDFTIRPQDRFKLMMDYLEFRAFFLVGVPTLDPSIAPDVYRAVYNSIATSKAGGVGFDLYIEDIGCT
jgi:hypothetical protein